LILFIILKVFYRQDDSAGRIIGKISDKMEFNKYSRELLKEPLEHITRLKHEAEQRLDSQVKHNHSAFTRRELIKIEAKKGYAVKLRKNK
jgi:hypothetical protein